MQLESGGGRGRGSWIRIEEDRRGCWFLVLLIEGLQLRRCCDSKLSQLLCAVWEADSMQTADQLKLNGELYDGS